MVYAGSSSDKKAFYRDADFLIPATFLLGYVALYFGVDWGVFSALKVTSFVVPVLFCILWMLPRFFGSEGSFFMGFLLALVVTSFTVSPILTWEMEKREAERRSVLEQESKPIDYAKVPLS